MALNLHVSLDDLCFDAQRAAEKVLKGLLIQLDVSFPYTHDLADLLTLVRDQGLAVADSVKESAILTDYAVVTRYPDVGEPVTEEEHGRAVTSPQRVVEWVDGQLGWDDETSNSRSD